MNDVFANVTIGWKRRGFFWWRTFNWQEGNVVRITTELAKMVGWKDGDKELVFGAYRLAIIRVDLLTNIIYGRRISGKIEETLRRIAIWIGDIAISPFPRAWR